MTSLFKFKDLEVVALEGRNKDKTREQNTGVFSKVSYQTIGERAEGQRIDNFLINHLKGVPKSKIYQIIRKGEVRVDKKRVKPTHKLSIDEMVRIPPVRTQPKGVSFDPNKHPKAIASIREAVIYEDEYIIVINKPSGLAVHGGSGVSMGLIELARAAWDEVPNLELVHRLDKDTSGCILLAKKPAILKELHRLIIANQIIKRYQALLSGRWNGTEHIVEAPLKKNTLKSGERVVRVSQEGKEATSIFSIKQLFKSSTYVEVKLITGRTHQIRVHAQFSGHAIIGDPKYGGDEINRLAKGQGLNRMFLHASELHIPLSVYKVPLVVKAPLDNNLQAYLDGLS